MLEANLYPTVGFLFAIPVVILAVTLVAAIGSCIYDTVKFFTAR